MAGYLRGDDRGGGGGGGWPGGCPGGGGGLDPWIDILVCAVESQIAWAGYISGMNYTNLRSFEHKAISSNTATFVAIEVFTCIGV